MGKIKFNGEIKLKDGKLINFDNIKDYNSFIWNNENDILSAQTTSEFVETDDDVKPEPTQNDKDEIVKTGRKLSDIIKIALDTITKELNNIENITDNSRTEICNKIGENCEEVINEYEKEGTLIKDKDECMRILNEFFEESKDNFNHYNNEYNEIVDDVKKLSERVNELMATKREKIKARANENFKCIFSNGMKNMVINLCAEFIPDDEIHEPNPGTPYPEVETEFKGKDGEILDLSDLIGSIVPWADVFNGNKNVNKRVISDNIRRLVKSIYDKE